MYTPISIFSIDDNTYAPEGACIGVGTQEGTGAIVGLAEGCREGTLDGTGVVTTFEALTPLHIPAWQTLLIVC